MPTLEKTARMMMSHLPRELRPLEAEPASVSVDEIVSGIVSGRDDIDSSYLGHAVQFGWRYQHLKGGVCHAQK